MSISRHKLWRHVCALKKRRLSCFLFALVGGFTIKVPIQGKSKKGKQDESRESKEKYLYLCRESVSAGIATKFFWASHLELSEFWFAHALPQNIAYACVQWQCIDEHKFSICVKHMIAVEKRKCFLVNDTRARAPPRRT